MTLEKWREALTLKSLRNLGIHFIEQPIEDSVTVYIKKYIHCNIKALSVFHSIEGKPCIYSIKSNTTHKYWAKRVRDTLQAEGYYIRVEAESRLTDSIPF